MTDEVWACHANPWSGLTIIPTLPILMVSIWSLVWIDWWCLIPITFLIIWVRMAQPNLL